MATVTNRDQFTDYCLRKLGFPVIEINVDPDQVSDRIDDALQYFQDYHFDGLQKTYYIHTVTQQDIDNKYLDLSNVTDNANASTQVVGVTRIFPLNDSQASVDMFDLRYQLRLNELYDFTSASYINYTMTMQHLRMLEQLFTGEVPIRYQRHMEKLFVDWAWGDQEAPVGQIVIDAKYEFYDFTAKYLDNSMQLVFPTDLPAGVEVKIQESAINAFNAAGCEGLARVDFFYSNDGQIIINEINTMPGFTPLSVYPKLMQKHGISYQELITMLISTALTRSANITR